MELTHASFFSGVGGLDLGLERQGWQTVSHSEVDTYACAVLAERWPDVPNLGDITTIAERILDDAGRAARERVPDPSRREPSAGRIVGDGPALADPAGGPDDEPAGRDGGDAAHRPDWRDASLWSGGFPCQDLSIAGKRSGFEGDRSSLAFTFLDLVERFRPPAILLENVPGLLSSNAGRDMARLLREVVELGYGVAWRSLDAQHFGVPQRRQRVFVVGLRHRPDDPDGHLAALRAAEVLAVGSRCRRHPPTGFQAGEEPADGPRIGLEIAGGLTRRYHKGTNTTLDDGALVLPDAAAAVQRGVVGALNNLGHHGWTANAQSVASGHVVIDPGAPDGAPPDAGGDGAPDGDAGRLDDRGSVAYYVAPESGQGADLTAHRVDQAPAITPTEYQRQTDRGVRVVGGDGGAVAPTLLAPNTHASAVDGRRQDGSRTDRIPTVFIKHRRAQSVDDPETWAEGGVAPTVNGFDTGNSRATALFVGALRANSGGWRPRAEEHPDMTVGPIGGDDPLLPVGLDSNRYRACGNAVVVNVAEWLGHRLAHALEDA